MKAPVEKIPYAALVECAKAIEDGDARPGRNPGDWLHGIRSSLKDIGAVIRHAYAFASGEDVDPDTGIHHCGYIMARCCIILERQRRGLPDERKPFAAHPEPGPVVSLEPGPLLPAGPPDGEDG